VCPPAVTHPLPLFLEGREETPFGPVERPVWSPYYEGRLKVSTAGNLIKCTGVSNK